MLCEKCGAQIPDGAQSCPFCYQANPEQPPAPPPAPVITGAPVYAAGKRDKLFLVRMILCGIGIIIGLYLIIAAISGNEFFQNYDFMKPLSYSKFGGDFYTYMYVAGRKVHEDVSFVAWFLTLLTGIGFTLGFGLRALTFIEGKKKSKEQA